MSISRRLGKQYNNPTQKKQEKITGKKFLMPAYQDMVQLEPVHGSSWELSAGGRDKSVAGNMEVYWGAGPYHMACTVLLLFKRRLGWCGWLACRPLLCPQVGVDKNMHLWWYPKVLLNSDQVPPTQRLKCWVISKGSNVRELQASLTSKQHPGDAFLGILKPH